MVDAANRKYALPERFHERVLQLEITIERQKEHTTHEALKQLTELYSQAIEYYGYMDDVETCMDLNLRMQSILVK